MRFKETEVWGFKHAFRGMRNPKASWAKSDSYINEYGNYVIGQKDMVLAQRLIRAGSEHRKFLRQIFVSVDITAPLYWWKEFDTYKVGTVANSTSTMHTLSQEEISLSNFEIDDCQLVGDSDDILNRENVRVFLSWLDLLRRKYLETKNKKYWKEIIRWLPEGWTQTRTVTLSYENILTMCGRGQRRFHKLNEWSGIKWARALPYAKELLFLDEDTEV